MPLVIKLLGSGFIFTIMIAWGAFVWFVGEELWIERGYDILDWIMLILLIAGSIFCYGGGIYLLWWGWR